MIEQLTCLILTYNEEPNIRRTLERLAWLKRIIVVDSYSTDRTLDILRTFPQVEVYQHIFEGFAQQCNYGLDRITTEWVLSLDADFVLSKELIAELQSIPFDTQVNSFCASFRHCINGEPLRGTLIPARHILYRKTKARYYNDGHGHRVQVEGLSQPLAGYIWHDDRKSIKRWLDVQDRYMVAEAQKLLDAPVDELNIPDRIRKLKILAPFLILLYCLIIKRGLLDGWVGWCYAFQRMLVELLLALRLIEGEWERKAEKSLSIDSSNSAVEQP